MKWQMRKCLKCGRYTLKDACPVCGTTTTLPHPAKFSPDDKYAGLRQPRRVGRTGEDSLKHLDAQSPQLG